MDSESSGGKESGGEASSHSDLPEADAEVQNQEVSTHDLLLAATYIEDARSGWKLSLHFDPTPANLRRYLLFRAEWVKFLLYFVLFIHHALALFEDPARPYLRVPFVYLIVIEVACICFYVYRCIHLLSFTSQKWFWRDPKNVVIVAVILLIILDIIIYLALQNSSVTPVRWSRPLRPLLIINVPESRQVRRAWRSVSRTLPDTLGTMILFGLNLLLFALMGYKLFSHRHLAYANGMPYFANYQDSLFDLYVLVTTANSPDIMMPALNDNPATFLFFVAFLLLSLYLFMNIFLAVIYNGYKRYLKLEVRSAVEARRQLMSRAFRLLSSGGDRVSRPMYGQVMSVLRPSYSTQLSDVLWRVLDRNSAGNLDEQAFYQLADLLNVKVTEVKDRVILIHRLFPRLYNSKPSLLLRHCVRQKPFRIFFDVLIVINAVLIAASLDQAEWAFLSLFLLEILLKLYTFGFIEFFDRLWNIFDFVVIGGAFLISVIEAATSQDGAVEVNRTVLDVLLVFRVLRVVKIISSVPMFGTVLQTIGSLSRSIVTFGGVLLCLYYFFALLGMELFSGRIGFAPFRPGQPSSCGDPRLADTDFGRLQYCADRFDSLGRSFALLFQLMVVNQWHVIVEGFVAVTSRWSRLYFVSFHISCVLVILNIFTAFVLEAFMLEYSADRTTVETRVEKQIHDLGLGLGSRQVQRETATAAPSPSSGGGSNQTDYQTLVESDELDADHEPRVDPDPDPDPQPGSSRVMANSTGVRFHLRRRARNVEVLLQRMFEADALAATGAQ